MNTLRPAIETDADGVITSFAILQEADPDYPTIRPHRLVVGFYNLHGGKLRRDFRHELDVDGERTEVPELVGQKRPDLVLVNDEDLAYAKIRLDDASLEVAMEHLEDIDDPLARAIVWGAAWDATRDAEARASDYVTLVLGNIAAETESTTIRTTLTQLLTVARAYVDPAKRDATIRAVGDKLWELAQDAEAGSDEQFQFVKFFANIASTPEHVAVLDGLLKGTAPLDGLEIDTDLGWELLEGLVLNGAAGDPEIDEFLEKDETSNGHQAAARARATHSTAKAKREAFLALADSDKLSNAIVRNVTHRLPAHQRSVEPAGAHRAVLRLAQRHLGEPVVQDRRALRARPLPDAARVPGARGRDAGVAGREPGHPGAAAPRRRRTSPASSAR